MVQHLTHEAYQPFDFSRSVYYPAGGFDLEPLQRLSHLFDTFIYANIFLTLEEIVDGITKVCGQMPGIRLKRVMIYDDYSEEQYLDPEPDYLRHLVTAFSWMPPEDRRLYNNTFLRSQNDPNFMVEFEIERTGLERTCRLIYIHSEALATYVVISKNGKIAPIVLCTIQTNILEEPNGLFTGFLERFAVKPGIWIRGFINDSGFLDQYSYDTIFMRDRLYPQTGIDFGSWKVHSTFTTYKYADYTYGRCCRGFISSAFGEAILQRPFKNYGNNSITYGDISKLARTIMTQDKTLIVITENLRRKLNFNGCSVQIMTWENVLGLKTKLSDANASVTMSRSLKALDELACQEHYDQIYFIPVGYEDEGIILDKFLNRSGQTRFTAMLFRPLDMIDLRQVH